MNVNSKHGLLRLGLDDLSTKDRANSWKPLLLSLVTTGGLLTVCMVLIWWFVG